MNVKVLLEYRSEILERFVVESLWAELTEYENQFKILNLPFYGFCLSTDDIVMAEKNEANEWIYKDIIKYSENSTITIFSIHPETQVKLFKMLDQNGIYYEGESKQLCVLEFPKEKNYINLKVVLNHLESNNIIYYGESKLSIIHRSQIKCFFLKEIWLTTQIGKNKYYINM